MLPATDLDILILTSCRIVSYRVVLCRIVSYCVVLCRIVSDCAGDRLGHTDPDVLIIIVVVNLFHLDLYIQIKPLINILISL